MAEQDLNGKVIVITDASSCFGKGLAMKFARTGARVVLAARRAKLLDELVPQCESAGGRADVVPTDVSNEREVERLAAAAISDFGTIGVWVNNAGAGALGRFDEVPLEEHVQVIQTHLMGTLNGSYFALQHFRAERLGAHQRRFRYWKSPGTYLLLMPLQNTAS